MDQPVRVKMIDPGSTLKKKLLLLVYLSDFNANLRLSRRKDSSIPKLIFIEIFAS